MGAKVYFTREITPENVVELYHALGPREKRDRLSSSVRCRVP